MAVRIAFLGCGGIAGAHMNQLAKVKQAKMVAFCDADAERAGKRAAEFGGKPYTKFEQMLRAEAFDALYVCLPPFAHEGQEITAAKKGLHLFVEKPVSLSMDYAKKVAAAIKKAGVVSCVGYQIRYGKHVTEARKLLAGRKVDMAVARYLCSMKGMKGWWPIMAKSGGQVVEQSTHSVDLMRYLAGDVTKVYASYTLREVTDRPDWDVPDYYLVNMELASGAVAMLQSAAAYPLGWDSGVQVVCGDMILDCGFGSLKVLRPGKEPKVIEGGGDPMLTQDSTFVRAVASGKQDAIRSSYADGAKTLAVTLAANESAAKGQPVSL